MSNENIISSDGEGIYANKAVRFRGISTTDPATGIVTLDGIKYELKDFTKENNGDIFYYRDVTRPILNNDEGVYQGVIYAYIYVDNSLKEDEFLEPSEKSGEFKKIGYGFYNNLSTLIVDNFIDKNANIKMSKISGLTDCITEIKDNLDYLSADFEKLSIDIESVNESLSIFDTDLQTISTSLDLKIINQQTNIISSIDADYLKKEHIDITFTNSDNRIPSSKLVSESLINVLRTDNLTDVKNIKTFEDSNINLKQKTIPSIYTLSGTLQDYAIKEHTHIIDDISNISLNFVKTTQIDTTSTNLNGNSDNKIPSSALTKKLLNEKLDKSNVDMKTLSESNDKVPSSSLLKSELQNISNNIQNNVNTLRGDFILTSNIDTLNISNVNNRVPSSQLVSEIKNDLNNRILTSNIDISLPDTGLDTRVPSTKLLNTLYVELIEKYDELKKQVNNLKGTTTTVVIPSTPSTPSTPPPVTSSLTLIETLQKGLTGNRRQFEKKVRFYVITGKSSISGTYLKCYTAANSTSSRDRESYKDISGYASYYYNYRGYFSEYFTTAICNALTDIGTYFKAWNTKPIIHVFEGYGLYVSSNLYGWQGFKQTFGSDGSSSPTVKQVQELNKRFNADSSYLKFAEVKSISNSYGDYDVYLPKLYVYYEKI